MPWSSLWMRSPAVPRGSGSEEPGGGRAKRRRPQVDPRTGGRDSLGAAPASWSMSRIRRCGADPPQMAIVRPTTSVACDSRGRGASRSGARRSTGRDGRTPIIDVQGHRSDVLISDGILGVPEPSHHSESAECPGYSRGMIVAQSRTAENQADFAIFSWRVNTQHGLVSRNIWRHYSWIGGRQKNACLWICSKWPLHMSEKVEP
jgi:hypothetical protein